MFVPPVATQGIAHKKTHVNLDYRAPNALRVSRTRLLSRRRLDLPAACSAQTMAACTLFCLFDRLQAHVRRLQSLCLSAKNYS
jgi:hypothetical protein